VTVVVPKEQVDRAHDYLNGVLEPFNERREVEPRKEYLTPDEVDSMAKTYGTTNHVEMVEKMEEWSGDLGGSDARGLYRLSTYNPQSKWDWWIIGGRWRGHFKVKPNMPYILGDETWGEEERPPAGNGDIVKKMDVDWEGMLHDSMESCRQAWRREDHRFLFTKATTEEEYVAEVAGIATFALIDKEGEWHERGNMGWWGVVTDEQDRGEWTKAYIEYVGSCDDDDMLFLLDCHI
jgi:hypothetical protein